MKTLQELQNIIEQRIKEQKFPDNPKNIYDPVRYILAIGGKRLRPALTLLSANMFSDNIEEAIYPSLGLEVFHNFTLLHDDIMDKSDLRRGNDTVHKKWNENIAILSGDAMSILAYRYMAKAPEDKVKTVLDIFSQTAIEVCEGQQYDMDFENRNDVKINEYIEMIRLKTSVLIAACLKIGAIIGGADNSEADKLYQFGINLGLAFQLQDDYLDVYGDEKIFGKPIGGDIVANKKTYLLVTALEKANQEQKEHLLNWINATDCNKEQKIKEVRELFTNTEAKSSIENEIKNYFIKAENYLNELNIKKDKKEELEKLMNKLMIRNK